jgi:hypothetical protein
MKISDQALMLGVAHIAQIDRAGLTQGVEYRPDSAVTTVVADNNFKVGVSLAEGAEQCGAEKTRIEGRDDDTDERS